MKLSSKELKRNARQTLNGRYGLPMGAFLLTELIILGIQLPFNLSMQHNPDLFQSIISSLASIIISLFSTVLAGGMIYLQLNMARGRQAKLSDLFYFFKRRPDRFILSALLLAGIFFLIMIPAILFTSFAIIADTSLWYAVLAFVWLATLIVLCMVSLSYSLIYYLLVDQPDTKILEIFTQSRYEMKGSKGRLFYLQLSFLGMYLLGLLSCGIGLFWVIPYEAQTQAEFYRNVIGEI